MVGVLYSIVWFTVAGRGVFGLQHFVFVVVLRSRTMLGTRNSVVTCAVV